MQGILKACTNLGKFTSGDDWVEFSSVNGLRLTGGGTFDGQGSSSWGNAQCPNNKYCKVLPVVRTKLYIYILCTTFVLLQKLRTECRFILNFLTEDQD
jgi:Glycosyl hydrolases family 28